MDVAEGEITSSVTLCYMCLNEKDEKKKKKNKSNISLTYFPHISALVHLHRSVQVVGFISGTLVSVG